MIFTWPESRGKSDGEGRKIGKNFEGSSPYSRGVFMMKIAFASSGVRWSRMITP